MEAILFILGIILVIFISLISQIFFTVDQQSIAIIERFGKFLGIYTAGLNMKVPFLDKVAGRVTLKVLQLDVKAQTKTKDNVFVHLLVSVQYYVLPDKAFDAFYKLNDSQKQINAYVFDLVRAKVPQLTLDELYEKKDDIAHGVRQELSETMKNYGFGIANALVTDIDPDEKVKAAMNEINTAQRLRLAASEKGEAERILKVKLAEAEAESKALQGQGIANQRRAIIEGLKDSVEDFQSSIKGSSANDVMNLVLMTQYFDTLKEMSQTSHTNTIMIPHSPSGMTDISDQIRNGIIQGNQVTLTKKN